MIPVSGCGGSNFVFDKLGHAGNRWKPTVMPIKDQQGRLLAHAETCS